jgi:hypothetical protein
VKAIRSVPPGLGARGPALPRTWGPTPVIPTREESRKDISSEKGETAKQNFQFHRPNPLSFRPRSKPVLLSFRPGRNPGRTLLAKKAKLPNKFPVPSPQPPVIPTNEQARTPVTPTREESRNDASSEKGETAKQISSSPPAQITVNLCESVADHPARRARHEARSSETAKQFRSPSSPIRSPLLDRRRLGKKVYRLTMAKPKNEQPPETSLEYARTLEPKPTTRKKK